MPRKVVNPKTGRLVKVGGATWSSIKRRSSKKRSPKRASKRRSSKTIASIRESTSKLIPRIPQYTMPPVPLKFI